MSNEVITFGKYKGQPASVLANDPSYTSWLTSQDWFVQRYPQINTLIINNFGEPADTPEHNRFQADFLKDEYVSRFVNYTILGSPCITDNFIERYDALARCIQQNADIYNSIIKKAEDGNYADYALRLIEEFVEGIKKQNSLCGMADVEFEVKGWDVVILAKIGVSRPHSLPLLACPGWDIRVNTRWGKLTSDEMDIARRVCSLDPFTRAEESRISFRIELKPCIGDDYPSVLRQILSRGVDEYSLNGYRDVFGGVFLIYKDFTATSVTEEEVKSIFQRSGIKAIRESEYWG